MQLHDKDIMLPSEDCSHNGYCKFASVLSESREFLYNYYLWKNAVLCAAHCVQQMRISFNLLKETSASLNVTVQINIMIVAVLAKATFLSMQLSEELSVLLAKAQLILAINIGDANAKPM